MLCPNLTAFSACHGYSRMRWHFQYTQALLLYTGTFNNVTHEGGPERASIYLCCSCHDCATFGANAFFLARKLAAVRLRGIADRQSEILMS